jgi:DNA-binding NtrC family response regulator
VIGFAKQSGGEVRVESAVGLGSTFILYMPRAEPGPTAPAPIADLLMDLGGDGLCVLLVEDNEKVGEFATQALKELGYDSILAVDAAHALTILAAREHHFHLVFSDVVMPGMSGLELGEEIRRLYPDLPVLLTSGYSAALAQTTDHKFELLQKPYSIGQLSRTIRKTLAESAARKAAAS